MIDIAPRLCSRCSRPKGHPGEHTPAMADRVYENAAELFCALETLVDSIRPPLDAQSIVARAIALRVIQKCRGGG